MYKTAFLGCGPRARDHAKAYAHVKGGQIIAICDQDDQRLRSFGAEFGVDAVYHDLSEMLKVEEPDVLHIITPPTVRHSVMKIASEHGVPAAIVEKPIALDTDDARDLRALHDTTNTKFVVNTQLNFHPRNQQLKILVAGGAIGDVKFIDASARSTPVNQGPHVIQLVSSYIDNARPIRVFGQVSGGESLSNTEPSPDHATASVTYENGVRAQLSFGTESAPTVNDSESKYFHKRVAVYGTKGHVEWTMAWWESCIDGQLERGEHTYAEQDLLGQAGLTEAVFDWLDDNANQHPTHLGQSLAEFELLLGLYVSSIERRPVNLPFEPPNGILDTLANILVRE